MMKNNQKNYATSSSCNRSCYFRKDYSYYVNHHCLGCKFCYNRTTPRHRPKYRTAGLLDIEVLYNDSVLKVPVTVSRYCDPLFSKTSEKNSIEFIEKILSRGGQIIFRTAKHSIPDKIYKIAEEYKDNFMYQGRIFLPTSKTHDIILKDMAPGFSKLNKILECTDIFNSIGNDTALFLDPFIVGINDVCFNDILDQASGHINKITIRQLFATSFFKEYLRTISRRLSNPLDVSIGQYYTYDNILLFEKISEIVKYIKRNKIDINLAICNNVQLDSIFNKYNCCMFSNANAVYDLSKSKNLRHSGIKELK